MRREGQSSHLLSLRARIAATRNADADNPIWSSTSEEGHHTRIEPSGDEGLHESDDHTSISESSESEAPVARPTTGPRASPLFPFRLVDETDNLRAPSFILTSPDPTNEQRANSMGLNLIRHLLLRPSPEAFGPGHRLIVNREMIDAAQRSSVFPLPVNILRMECSGVDSYTRQWPPGITCLASIRICTYDASHYVAGAWKFTLNALNPTHLECTEEVIGLHLFRWPY